LTLAFTGSFGAVLYGMRREWEHCRAYTAEATQIAERHGFRLWFGVGRMVSGWAERGAVEEVRAGMAVAGETGNQALMPMILGVFADSCRAAGRDAEAVSAADLGLAVGERTQQHFWRPELLRLKGEAFLRLADHSEEEAERRFRSAIEVAEGQEARSLELRAATSLAGISQRQKKSAEARDFLQPVYDSFTQGFDTQDLKVAKALLEELRA